VDAAVPDLQATSLQRIPVGQSDLPVRLGMVSDSDQAEAKAPAIELTEVVSSTISRIGYDAEKRLLYVKFMSGGWYAYQDVPADKHQEFIESESKGKHFHANIRGADPKKPKYLFTKVLADDNDIPQAPKIEN
jgi:hypothetical protein